jgi:hypothetical protein
LAKEGCKQCYQDAEGNEIPRKYFVDESSMDVVAQLGQAVSGPSPDPNAIGQLAGGIGNEIYLECHLVHLPAQNAKNP